MSVKKADQEKFLHAAREEVSDTGLIMKKEIPKNILKFIKN